MALVGRHHRDRRDNRWRRPLAPISVLVRIPARVERFRLRPFQLLFVFAAFTRGVPAEETGDRKAPFP